MVQHTTHEKFSTSYTRLPDRSRGHDRFLERIDFEIEDVFVTETRKFLWFTYEKTKYNTRTVTAKASYYDKATGRRSRRHTLYCGSTTDNAEVITNNLYKMLAENPWEDA